VVVTDCVDEVLESLGGGVDVVVGSAGFDSSVGVGVVVLAGGVLAGVESVGSPPPPTTKVAVFGRLGVQAVTTVYVTANAELLAPLFGSAILFLPTAFWVAMIAAVVLWLLLRRTSVGQGLTAVGLNESGAIFAGMRTRLLKVLAFALSGLLAGIAGIMIIAQAGAAPQTLLVDVDPAVSARARVATGALANRRL